MPPFLLLLLLLLLLVLVLLLLVLTLLLLTLPRAAAAAFLIGAGERSYYTCSRGWKVQEDPVAQAWHPEYDKPLGTPVGLGKKGEDGVWRRTFKGAKGETVVEFDSHTGNGTIAWAGEASNA